MRRSFARTLPLLLVATACERAPSSTASDTSSVGGSLVAAIHTEIAQVSADDARTWLGDRFARRPATSTCAPTP